MKIERGVPTPQPTANERVHRLDAEAEAWMKNYAAVYARAVDRVLAEADLSPAPWHEENIRKYWPELWTLWSQYQQTRLRLARHVENVRQRYPGA